MSQHHKDHQSLKYSLKLLRKVNFLYLFLLDRAKMLKFFDPKGSLLIFINFKPDDYDNKQKIIDFKLERYFA